jgi:hypothetical protein
MVAKNRVGIKLSYQPARQHRLAESALATNPGLFKSLKIPALLTDERDFTMFRACATAGFLNTHLTPIPTFPYSEFLRKPVERILKESHAYCLRVVFGSIPPPPFSVANRERNIHDPSLSLNLSTP